ncbi:MAG TPA: response regulator [Devosia sp.]|nr:response regulator [Devosia sp.]
MPSVITVLIVEDEALIRMDISGQLQNFGFKVFEAANASEAIEMLIANAEIQVMFTDIDMPGGVDGLVLSAAVRDRWPPIKIIVTSGHRRVEMSDIPAESRFFRKPYRAETVAVAMREMMAV